MLGGVDLLYPCPRRPRRRIHCVRRFVVVRLSGWGGGRQRRAVAEAACWEETWNEASTGRYMVQTGRRGSNGGSPSSDDCRPCVMAGCLEQDSVGRTVSYCAREISSRYGSGLRGGWGQRVCDASSISVSSS